MVTVFLPETDDEVQLSPEEEAKLEKALKEADQGDFIETRNSLSMSLTADRETPP